MDSVALEFRATCAVPGVENRTVAAAKAMIVGAVVLLVVVVGALAHRVPAPAPAVAVAAVKPRAPRGNRVIVATVAAIRVPRGGERIDATTADEVLAGHDDRFVVDLAVTKCLDGPIEQPSLTILTHSPAADLGASFVGQTVTIVLRSKTEPTRYLIPRHARNDERLAPDLSAVSFVAGCF
jgi:hypothetical protein